MVSLGRRNFNTSGTGAVFFDASVNMDDEEYLEPVLSSEAEENSLKLETTWIAAVPLLLGISLELAGIVFVCLWPEEKDKCETYFILLYLHCAYWFVVMISDHILKFKHVNLRVFGYLEFYQTTYQTIRTPLFITSLWNTVFLTLAVILHHTHKTDYQAYCRASEWFTPLNYILLLITLELMIVVPVYIQYIRKVVKFNRSTPPPDVSREEWLSTFAQDSYAGTGGEVGYRQPATESVTNLLEKQADLIRYLREYNNQLSQRMMQMTQRRGAEA